MDREHLCKAKRVNWMELPKEEWWVEGYYVKHGSRHWIYTGEIQYMYYPVCADLPTKYEVERETVSEYTGLTDRNDRKIFENDIVSAPFTGYAVKKEERKGVVEFVNGAFSVNWNDSEEYGKNFVEYVHEIKVIGNIFDNQEILQETNSE